MQGLAACQSFALSWPQLLEMLESICALVCTSYIHLQHSWLHVSKLCLSAQVACSLQSTLIALKLVLFYVPAEPCYEKEVVFLLSCR